VSWAGLMAATAGVLFALSACADSGDVAGTAPTGNGSNETASSGLDGDGSVEGVVIAVDGTLAEVSSFTVRLPDGTDATFVPQPGILFDETAPIGHVRDHLVSGAPVLVEYVTLENGELLATAVGDA